MVARQQGGVRHTHILLVGQTVTMVTVVKGTKSCKVNDQMLNFETHNQKALKNAANTIDNIF